MTGGETATRKDTSGACAHCGLRLGRWALDGEIDGRPAAFCCPGCALAAQVTRARGEPSVAAALLIRLGLAIFFAMNVMVVSLPTYAPFVYGDELGAAEGPLFAVLRVLAACFSLPVLALLGLPIARGAWAGLRARRANSDLLVTLALAAALGLSIAHLVAASGPTYFETAVGLLVLVTLGRFLEARARAEAGERLRSAAGATPTTALRLERGARREVPVDGIEPGDVIEVDPGGAIPTDGVIVSGSGGVDESRLTGESRPLAKGPGAAVAGGTVSLEARLRIRVTRPRAESAAARIERLLEDARREPSALERTADAVAAWAVPAVVGIAAAVAAAWAVAGDAEGGVRAAVAVLVVACPCALGIATPVALWTALVAAAGRGVIVRSAPLLERAAKVGVALLDKTGTLTDDVPSLTRIEVLARGLDADAALARAAALERRIAHPVARALVREARGRGLELPEVENVRLLEGGGVRGQVGREPLEIRAGSGDAADEVELRGMAGPLARFQVREVPRPGARRALERLSELGAHVEVLSGDRSASAIAPALVPTERVLVGCTPTGKLERVRAWRRRAAPRLVAMVGDGSNDAPALAAADLGIAFAAATDLARVAADVVVLGGDLGHVPWLLAHARRTRRIVLQNLAWAFGYNATAIGIASIGLLSPLVASLAMIGSSAAVLWNARRLRGSGSRPAEARWEASDGADGWAAAGSAPA